MSRIYAGIRHTAQLDRRHAKLALLGGACVTSGAVAGAGHGTLALAALVAFAGALLVVELPLVGTVVLITLVPALSGLNRGLLVPGLRLSEVLIVAVAVITFATIARGDPWGKFDWLVLAYVLCTLGFGLVDLTARGTALSLGQLGTLLGPLEFLLLYRAVRARTRQAKARDAVVKWMLLASIPIAVLAIFQFINVPGTRALAVTWAGETNSLELHENTFYRATALFAQGHLLGAYLMLIILVGVASVYDSRRPPLARRAILAIVLLDGLAIGATATATPIIGCLAGILGLAYWYKRLARALVGLAVAGVLSGLIFSSTISARLNQEFAGVNTHHLLQYENIGTSSFIPNTLLFRWDVWVHQYLPTIEQNWATGYGADLPPGAIWQHTESAYVSILLRGGVLLLVLFGWLMRSVARVSRRVDDDRRPVARALFVATVALAFMQIDNNYLLDTGLAQLWWALVGMLTAGVVARSRRAVVKPARATPGPLAAQAPPVTA